MSQAVWRPGGDGTAPGGLALKSGCKEEDSDAGKSGSLNGDQRELVNSLVFVFLTIELYICSFRKLRYHDKMHQSPDIMTGQDPVGPSRDRVPFSPLICLSNVGRKSLAS